MEYCHYHPLAPATYYCPNCDSHHCDRCVDEGESGTDSTCFNCNRSMEFLGAVNNATPFWRRLEASFRYPLHGETLVLIVGVSFLTGVVSYLPFGILWVLMLTGAFIKYCFACLEQTASGRLVPPDITEAYGGGLVLVLRLLGMILALGGAVVGAFMTLGPPAANFLGFLIVLALPAMVILFAMTDSVGDALNPANLFRLITAIGLPYGLILGFIMIMSASVGVINQLIGNNLAGLSAGLQSVVANYYTVVMFHIMGYMIFQYQGQLGFTAGEDVGEMPEPRSQRDRLAAKIDITLKNGDYNGVVELLNQALSTYPNDRDFNKQYFEFLYATRRTQVIDKAASRYLDFLIRTDQSHLLTMIYKRVIQLKPEFKPATARVRHQLAAACREGGDPLSAVKLVNGLHKEFPDYPHLPEAFEVMAGALDDLPGKEAQAHKCRQLAQHLAAKRPKPVEPSQVKKAAPANFPIGEKPSQQPPSPESEPESEETAAEPVEDNDRELPPIEFK